MGVGENSIVRPCKWNWKFPFISVWDVELKADRSTNEQNQDEKKQIPTLLLIAGHVNITEMIKSRLYLAGE